MVIILFEGFEFGFECFEFLSNDSSFDRISRISFLWFEFGFECFECLFNGL